MRKIIAHLEDCYANHVGIEFKYISDQQKVDFLTGQMEKKFLEPIPLEKKKRILEKLNEGVIFEKFLHTKYVGQKRFSLEGVFLGAVGGPGNSPGTFTRPKGLALDRAEDRITDQQRYL